MSLLLEILNTEVKDLFINWETAPSLLQKYEVVMQGVPLDQHHPGVPVVPAVAGGNGSWVCF